MIIGGLTFIFTTLGYCAVSVFGIPIRLHIPAGMRIAGLGVLSLGFAFMVWLYRYRSPIEVLTSTYVTMRKAIMRMPMEETSSRKESLILQGPQRHVRHPLYFAVIVLLLGWWLLLDYTILLFITVFFFLWFTLVVIRFEEKELKALFGEEYEAYARAVPMIFPSLKCRWPPAGKRR